MPVNCAGIPETLLESELFGHVKGSFTGAYRDKPGKLEMADNGTIFLDEIGEMTLRMQGLLLRFLETGEIQKVGAERMARATNVRVMAATNRDLRDLIKQGLFREDLYYRINVIHLVVPPLRDRREDIPLLVEHFLRRFTQLGDPAVAGQAYGQGNGNGRHYSPVRGIVARGARRALRVLLARQRPPGGERRRAADRHGPQRDRAARGPAGGDPDAGTATATPHPAASAGARWPTICSGSWSRTAQSFWQAVYPLYMNREITRNNVRELVHKGLEEARGNYKIVLKLFNMETRDYKRFLNFLGSTTVSCRSKSIDRNLGPGIWNLRASGIWQRGNDDDEDQD